MQHQIKCWPSQYFIKVRKHIDYSQSCLHFHHKEHYRNICKILTLCLDSMMEFLMLKVENMDPKDRCVSLIFDEMALTSALVYNNGLDIIEGLEDLGELGSSHFVADHALAFMVRGLYTKWKQPLAYFLTAGTVRAETLQTLTQMFSKTGSHRFRHNGFDL